MGQAAEVTPRKQPRFSFYRLIALFLAALLWMAIVSMVWSQPDIADPFSPDAKYFLPPIAWALALIAPLLRARRWVDAASILALYPLALCGNVFLIFLVRSVDIWPPNFHLPDALITTLLSGFWLMLGLLRYRLLMQPNGEMPGSATWNRARKTLGFLEILLVIFVLATAALLVVGPSANEGYPIRARVSELVLAASSAKTPLSEGMQQSHSWSAEWMSSITISATGMVASATIGPTGQIIVYGTDKASHAVVTLTPTITTDDKLVWTCVGRPAKYMPASCR
jgi:type IV pilus assembly protein PilA